MKFVKSNHSTTLKNEHLGELIHTALTTYCPGFRGLENQTSGFAARWCFWFYANDSSIEQFAHPWFILCLKKHG